MSKFIIPVFYQMWGRIEIEASSIEEAKEKVLNESPLPSDPSYVDDSFEIDEAGVPIYNLIKGREDECVGD